MPKKCQVVRPGCMNFSLDVHKGAVAYPFVPMPAGMYFTVGPTEWFFGDKQNAKVRQTGDGLIKLGHDCKYLRPHLFFPAPCPEVIFWVVHSATGSSKTVWGSFKTKHGDDPIALMFLDFDMGWMALINQLNCGDLPINPNVVSIQAPTNVFAGMSLGDIVGCSLQIIVDAAISFLVDMVTDSVKEALEHTALGALEKKVSKSIGSKLLKAPLLRGLVDKSMEQRQFRAAAQVLMRSQGDPLRYKIAEQAVALVRARFSGQATKTLLETVTEGAAETLAAERGDKLEEKYGLKVNPLELVVNPAEALSKLVASDHSAHYDYVAALIDGRTYSPPEKHPTRARVEPAKDGGIR